MARSAARTAAPTSSSALARLLISGSFVLVCLVVVLSAYLRLAGSGLGCEPWPACYATFKAEGGAWRDIAAIQVPIPAWATFIHRLVATVLGVFILGLSYLGLKRLRRAPLDTGIAAALFLLTLFLSVLGYKTPSPLWPWVTMANLLGGLVMLALLWWWSSRELNVAMPLPAKVTALRPLAAAALAIGVVQIALGGWVSANYAAAACPGLVSCDGVALREAIVYEAFNLARVLPVSIQGNVAQDANAALIQLVHRWFALASAVLLVITAWRARETHARLKTTATLLLAVTVLQVLLGAVAVVTVVPLALVTLHNTLAALLLLALVHLNHLLYYRPART